MYIHTRGIVIENKHMTSSLKEPLISFVFEHRHGLVGILGCVALLIMWMDMPVFENAMNEYYLILACAVSGTLLILIGVVIRLWSGLYIGGHKNSDLVTEGPYSLIRNPLYAGNLISALGVMLMTQSLLATLVVMAGLSVIYVATINHEEKKLLRIFGSDYAHYLETTPRLIPQWKTLGDLLYGTDNSDLITYRNLARELKRGGLFVVTGLLVLFASGMLH